MTSTFKALCMQGMLGIGLLTLGMPVTAQQAPGASLTIIQKPVEGLSAMGEWTLLKPDGGRATSPTGLHNYEQAPSGNYLLSIVPPSGMNAQITQVLNGVETLVDKPQISFILGDGDTATMTIQLLLVQFGRVSVDSSPAGLPFTLVGPDDASYADVTPKFFEGMPVGLYSVQFDPIPGCPNIRQQSDRLVKDGRIALSVEIRCDNLDALPQQQAKELTLRFVEATVEGVSVTFEDVPLDQWFSEPVHRILEAKVMSGYRDSDGKPSGQFGPSDPVTLAELAKVAQLIAGMQTDQDAIPENHAARGVWFAPYIAAAEEQDWLVYLDRETDPLRPATRAEVTATLLQALSVARDWPKGIMFTDVLRTTPFADCIETAASKGLVEGRKDAAGKPLNLFDPLAPINRAEMAKMLAKAMDVFLKDTPMFQPD